ncbi:MAG: hypothetical protein AAF939_11020 [Planctomycetota bacterium]
MTKHIEERIELLNREISAKRIETNIFSNISLVLGLIVVIALGVYFGYGYKALNDVTQPEMVVSYAKAQITDASVEVRKVATEEIKKSAPVWAQEASTQFINNIPGFSENLEATVEEYFNEQLAVSQAQAGEEFQKIIENHRNDFKEAIDLMVEEGNSDEFVEKILPIVEQSSEIDLKDNAMVVMGSLIELNDRLDKLSSGKDLNPLEKQQKHILGLTRLLRESSK